MAAGRPCLLPHRAERLQEGSPLAALRPAHVYELEEGTARATTGAGRRLLRAVRRGGNGGRCRGGRSADAGQAAWSRTRTDLLSLCASCVLPGAVAAPNHGPMWPSCSIPRRAWRDHRPGQRVRHAEQPEARYEGPLVGDSHDVPVAPIIVEGELVVIRYLARGEFPAGVELPACPPVIVYDAAST